VLVHVRMPLAFLRADPARADTRFEHRLRDLMLVVGLAREHTPGRYADVGAVEAEPDAAAQLDDVRLRERRVGADGARRVGVGARVDAGGHEFAIDVCRQRVGLEDLKHHRAIRRNVSEGAPPS
jgi:hypothetical protein